MNLKAPSGEVTVYNFRVLDRGFESAPVSAFKATRQAILERFGGDPIEGTGEQVSLEDLDAQGRFQRRATGWGDLS